MRGALRTENRAGYRDERVRGVPARQGRSGPRVASGRAGAANPGRPDDVVKVGDEIKVRVIEAFPQGRVNLTAIGLDEPFDP